MNLGNLIKLRPINKNDYEGVLLMYFWTDLLFLTGILACIIPTFSAMLYKSLYDGNNKKKSIITTTVLTAVMFLIPNLLYIFTYFLQFTY